MDKKRFTMIDEDFICLNCGKTIKKLGYTARDHCPYCLCSIHVDNNPGDRECTCSGLMKPIGIKKNKKNLYQIVYKCQKCGAIKNNIQALDDDINEIIRISVIE